MSERFVDSDEWKIIKLVPFFAILIFAIASFMMQPMYAPPKMEHAWFLLALAAVMRPRK